MTGQAGNYHGNQSRLKPYHSDILFFLLIIPIISAFNFYLTYPNLKFSSYYLMRFLIDTAQGYLAWWAVRCFILYLDRKWPYEKGPVKRIILQLFATTLIGLFIIASTTELLSWIVTGKPAITKFYTFDLFIISIWFYVINGVYIGIHYYNQFKQIEGQRVKENQLKSKGFTVRQGKQEIKLDFESLVGFFVDGEYVVACVKAGKKYYTEYSLDQLEGKLPADQFFRINRQIILHRQVLTSFKSSDQGKTLLLLTQNDFFPSEILISRLKGPAFKKWFRA